MLPHQHILQIPLTYLETLQLFLLSMSLLTIFPPNPLIDEILSLRNFFVDIGLKQIMITSRFSFEFIFFTSPIPGAPGFT